MQALRDSINQLIEKTLTMEQNPEISQDPRLQKMTEEAIGPCYQSQPYKEENIEGSQIEIHQQINQPEKTKISLRLKNLLLKDIRLDTWPLE